MWHYMFISLKFAWKILPGVNVFLIVIKSMIVNKYVIEWTFFYYKSKTISYSSWINFIAAVSLTDNMPWQIYEKRFYHFHYKHWYKLETSLLKKTMKITFQ